ncbi:MAG: S8 family serine peptidase [Prosthecobacter sp.]|nr:S8 family serine peptidase [Prosthecobacter sp.]
MSFWLKVITTVSAAVCIVSLLALSGLASRTTEGERTDRSVPGWQSMPAAASDTGAMTSTLQLLSGILPVVADQGNQLVDRLAEINNAPGVVRNELLLSFKSPEALAAFRARAAGQGLRVVSSDPRLLSARVRYDSPEAMARELRDNADDYENIGLNYLVWVPGMPDETQTDANNAGGRQPYGDSGLAAIGATGDRSTWGRGVSVALLDTGVTEHPSLSGTQVVHYDLVKDGTPPNGHGTAMASLIAGTGEDEGGAATASRLMDIRVADVNGESNTALVADGIMQAVDQGARVINISLGTTGDSAVLRRAVAYAVERGVVIVAAAGNEQQTTLSYPAGYEGVISVGAMDAEGVQAYFSNSGETLTISAPGVGIVSAYSNGRTVIGSGTSQATAITTGVVSTLLGWGYLPQNIVSTLTSSAQQTGAPQDKVGAGLLQVPKR